MLRQYLDAKEKHPQSLLLFRMGDFYELFFDDAKIAAAELDIALTSRNKGAEDEIPMAGVPHHAVSRYIQQLIRAGHTVAICDQVEEASKAKGLVEREVVRVVTPGVCLDLDESSARVGNYLASIAPVTGNSAAFGIALADVSTGELRVSEVGSIESLWHELGRGAVRELLVVEGCERVTQHPSRNDAIHVTDVPKSSLSETALSRRLRDLQAGYSDREHRSAVKLPHEVESLVAVVDGMGLRHGKSARSALCSLLSYLAEVQLGVPAHMTDPAIHRPQDYVALDAATEANLEIFQALIGGGRGGSLMSVVDHTVTAIGARLLHQALAYPLTDTGRIEARLDVVETFTESEMRRSAIRERLREVADIPRLTSRVVTGGANARELVALRHSLEQIPCVLELSEAEDPDLLKSVFSNLDPCSELVDLLNRALVDEPPATTTDGGMFKDGYHPDLDELLELSRSGKGWLLSYEQAQRKESGIDSLKLRYNRVFGYYLEVTKANLHKVPENFIRKQTLATCERYFTLELKEYEDKILGAEDRRSQLEIELFAQLVKEVTECSERLFVTSTQLAKLDFLSSLAELAVRYAYIRPVVNDQHVTEIVEGRHPVVERTIVGERFVPNSVSLDCEHRQLLIVTGPNMAGKSTIIRQVALITLLGQVGSFVPAKEATLGMVDQIFSRVGANDNLAQGQSTFMVEMTQTAHILAHATERSLIILDEIGRGTSTFDGLSIAWAVAEHISDTIGARTMFATHYHELTELTKTREKVRNVSVAVKEWNDEIVFLRRLVDSPANQSYGIQVARLAGLPQTTIDRAKQVLSNLESSAYTNGGTPVLSIDPNQPDVGSDQFDLFAPPALSPGAASALAALEAAEVDVLTPIEALNLIYTLKHNLDPK